MKFLLGWTRTFRRLSLSLPRKVRYTTFGYPLYNDKTKNGSRFAQSLYIYIYMYLVQKYWQEKWTKKSLKGKMSETQYESIILKTPRLY